MTRFLLQALATLLVSVLGLSMAAQDGPGPDAKPTIPALTWEPRSDWVNVRTSGAKGDGVADDSDAIQKALDGVKDGSTVYFPAGTYRLTRMLTLIGPHVGVLLVGHGRDTKLVWDGPEGGKMFKDDGVAYSRFVGLFFDGRNKAAVGFYHYSDTRFETEVRHQHLAFVNFTDAGILAEPKDKYALAETNFENCLFENCRCGVVFLSFNDYDYTFDGCEFRDCDLGLECRHGNFYVRNSHFQNSRTADILALPEHGCSVRRCTSTGSKRFLELNNPVTPMTVQDCQVANWTNPEGAISLSGAPVILMDCTFTGGPEGKAPVRIARQGQRVIVSENKAPDAPSVIQPGHAGKVYEVPAGKRKACLQLATQHFMRDTARIPGKVFDAKRDFGAKGDGGTDDTAAIQKCIDAAREHGKEAIAYLPTGTYAIAGTLKIAGKDYFVGGTGFNTKLLWKGAEGGIMIAVHDPQHVTLEQIAVGNHDSGKMNNAIDILQTGTNEPSHMSYDGVFVFGMYQKQPFLKGLQLKGLGRDAIVLLPHVQGNLHFTDCAQATILACTTFEGSVVVDGKDLRRDGLLGFQTRLATIVTHGLYLRDNQSIVMSDFYVEQADNGYVFEGAPGLPPGRATIQGAKVHFVVPKDDPSKGTAMTINNYGGRIFFGHDQFYVEPPNVRIVQTGEQAVELFVMANCFYKTHPDLKVGPQTQVYFLGNDGARLTEEAVKEGADDRLPPEALAKIAEAFDDLRRLGETDLKLKYGARSE